MCVNQGNFEKKNERKTKDKDRVEQIYCLLGCRRPKKTLIRINFFELPSSTWTCKLYKSPDFGPKNIECEQVYFHIMNPNRMGFLFVFIWRSCAEHTCILWNPHLIAKHTFRRIQNAIWNFWNWCQQNLRHSFRFTVSTLKLTHDFFFFSSAFIFHVRRCGGPFDGYAGIILFDSFKNSNFCIDCDSAGLDRGLSCVGSSGICVCSIRFVMELRAHNAIVKNGIKFLPRKKKRMFGAY